MNTRPVYALIDGRLFEGDLTVKIDLTKNEGTMDIAVTRELSPEEHAATELGEPLTVEREDGLDWYVYERKTE